MKRQAFFIAGPTASGKSEAAVELCKRIGGEIIGADSMQIYKGFDISTAMPTARQRAEVPHHMIDFLDPSEAYSVGRYVADAKEAIDAVFAKGKVPVICGGTGLYIDSLVNGIDFTVSEGSLELRRQLEKDASEKGPSEMHDRLEALDPESAAAIPENNIRRVIRALELNLSTGKTMKKIKSDSKSSAPDFKTLGFVLTFSDRKKLYDRIEKRIDNMIENGLVCEARRWYNNRDCLSATASQAIGCKEFYDYFNGEADISECVELLKKDTRHYAKRQITWFAREVNAVFVDCCSFKTRRDMYDFISKSAMRELMNGDKHES